MAGDANAFLKRIIIEVVTENYRQMLAEAVEYPADKFLRLDPPLRANERGISGLFSGAVGNVSARYRSEARVDRPGLEEDDLDSASHAGRVDYLAWYERRVIGLELKVSSMNAETGLANNPLIERWSQVLKQAEDVQKDLRGRNKEDNTSFPYPLSIALLVVIGRRRMKEEKVNQTNLKINAIIKTAEESLGNIGGQRKPRFVSVYAFPDQFRVFYPKRKGYAVHSEDNSVIYTPFVAFLARAFVNSKSA
jgi:hypothetical protein